MICIFVGYDTQSKTYKLYNPMTGKVIISRNVKLDEASWSWHEKSDDIQFKISIENEAPPTVGQQPIPPNIPSSSSSTSSSSRNKVHPKMKLLPENSGHWPKFMSAHKPLVRC